MLNLSVFLEASAGSHPDRDAVVLGDLRLTYAQVNGFANQVANLLVSRGIEPGDKVALYMRNRPAYSEVLGACFKARLVHVNVNYRYVDEELRYLLANADAKGLIYHAEFAPTLARVLPELPRDRFLQAPARRPPEALPRAGTPAARREPARPRLPSTPSGRWWTKGRPSWWWATASRCCPPHVTACCKVNATLKVTAKNSSAYKWTTTSKAACWCAPSTIRVQASSAPCLGHKRWRVSLLTLISPPAMWCVCTNTASGRHKLGSLFKLWLYHRKNRPGRAVLSMCCPIRG